MHSLAGLLGAPIDEPELARYVRAMSGNCPLYGWTVWTHTEQGDPTVAVGVELDVIAAVVIGGASLSGGEGGIAGAMIGALVMAFLRNGSQQMGWPNYVQEIIIGVVIVLAVAADRWRASRAAEGS